jgi:hypothetical protein
MRRVVISEDFREFEIHPTDLFDKYLEITKNELQSYLKEWNLLEINCPACNSDQKKPAFNKFGMDYVECEKCKTLYVTPRPSDEDISLYYKNSKAMTFWKENFYKETLQSRERAIFRPRALWVVSLTEEFFKKPQQFIDVKFKYGGYIEEINKLDLFQNRIILDPTIKPPEFFNEQKGLEIIDKPIDTISDGEFNANTVSALEVIDRISNPRSFIEKVSTFLIDGGLLFSTTSTISGFDLQILWDRSKNIYPLDHLNLFSIEGINELFTNCGFEIIELSTPGQLDFEIVKNAIKADPNIELPRFISYLIEHRDENTHRAFQDFLQRFRLSSHTRIAARKNK